MHCDLSCDNKYIDIDLFALASCLRSWSGESRGHVNSKYKVAWVTRSMSGKGGGILRLTQVDRKYTKLGYIFAADSIHLSLSKFSWWAPKTRVFRNRVRNGRSRSSKIVDFGTNRKRACNFLLLINSNLALASFQRYCRFSAKNSDSSPIGPLGLCSGSEERSNYFRIKPTYDHGSTSTDRQTDGQTDGWLTVAIPRNVHSLISLCTLLGIATVNIVHRQVK